jgi:hypothetical protein
MIFKGLRLIRDELQSYLVSLGDTSASVALENIAMLESGDDHPLLKNHIIITLVNVEEESTLKNNRAVVKSMASNGVTYENPPVHLNLYLLFCANFSGDSAAPGNIYEEALKRLSRIIQFFQAKNTFTIHNSQSAPILNNVDPDDEEWTSLKMTLDLYTLTFEQINHLWGSLGGKQVPFVMYKARLVAIKDRLPLRGGALIEEIHSSENIN